MKTHFDIESIVKKGFIKNELDYDRALIADRKLRLLANESPHFKTLRSKLRNLIEEYENSILYAVTEKRTKTENKQSERKLMNLI